VTTTTTDRINTRIPKDALPFNLVPFETTLVKASREKGKWVVFLEASNEHMDQEDERVFQKALKEAADYYMGHGVLSWDHRHKEPPYDPKFIIGEPLDIAFTDRSPYRTLIKGRLYEENELAKGLMLNLASGSTRIGSSVGGYVLHKSKGRDGGVDQVYWDETALTWKPMNDTVLGNVGLVPFKEFIKSLMAGSGVNAADFSGGRAMIGEELMGVKRPALSPGQLELLFDNVIGGVQEGEIEGYNDLVSFVLDKGYEGSVAAQIIDFLMSKIPSFVNELM